MITNIYVFYIINRYDIRQMKCYFVYLILKF